MNDKVAVVAGAARGIGRAIALEFAKEGANAVVNDVIDASNVIKEIENLGERALHM